MFKKTMSEQLKRIFGLGEVSFNAPSESQEQEGIFVQVINSRTIIKDTREIARVEGRIFIFVQNDKMPFGFLAKRINGSSQADTKPFFFFNIEEHVGSLVNIGERSVEFVYLFDSQYNPDRGLINEIDLIFKGVQ